MNEETIVAVFENPARAQAAVSDLRRAHIPEASIECHGRAAVPGSARQPAPQRGFWSRMIGSRTGGAGGSSESALAAGATVVTVRVIAAQAYGVIEILDNHGPIDIDERAIVDGVTESTSRPANTQTGGVETDIPLRATGISAASLAPATARAV